MCSQLAMSLIALDVSYEQLEHESMRYIVRTRGADFLSCCKNRVSKDPWP